MHPATLPSGLLQISTGWGGVIEVGTAFLTSAALTFVTTLVAGEVLLSSRSEQVSQSIVELGERPVRSFLYGLIPFVAGGAFLVLLPGEFSLLVFAVGVWVCFAAGAAVAFLAIARRFVDSADDSTKTLLVAAALPAGLTLTGIGGSVAFCIGAAGCGAILNTWPASDGSDHR